MHISQLADTPEDVNRAKAMFADSPPLASLLDEVVEQWYILMFEATHIIGAAAELGSEDCAFLVRMALQRSLRYYTLDADLRAIYHEYSPVMLRQMMDKIKKLSLNKAIELLEMASQDPEHALDCLDAWIEQHGNVEDADAMF